MNSLEELENSCGKLISILLPMYVGLYHSKPERQINKEFTRALDMVFSQHLKTGLKNGLHHGELDKLFERVRQATIDHFILEINTKPKHKRETT